MELIDDETIKKHAKQCTHCNQKILLPFEYEWTCISCGFNLIKRKQEFSKIQRKRISFINPLKYAEQKPFCICIDVYELYEGSELKKLYEVLSILENEKLKMNNISIEKYKDLIENPDFEQDHFSRTTEG